MNKRLSKFLSIALPLLLGLGLVVYKYNDFTPEQIAEMKMHFRHADYFYIGLSLFIALFGFLSRAYRWKYALNYLGYHPTFHNNLLSVCISYFVNLTIPRSGEISRAVIINKYEKVPFDKAFGTIVAERIVDLLIFFLVVLVSLAVQFRVLKEFILSKIPLQDLVILFFIGCGLMVIFILLWIYSKMRIVLELKKKVAGLAEGILSIWRMPHRVPFILHSLFIWFTYLLMFYVSIFALPETSDISFEAVTMAFIFGSLAIGFTNSGFGVYPVLVAEVFILYGIPETAGTAFGWIVWISQTLLMVLLGALSFLLLPVLNRSK